MHKREEALHLWLKNYFNETPFYLLPLAGDASFRKYFRIKCNETTYVLMDAPPEKEAILPFVTLAKLLFNHGVHTPKIYAVNVEYGFALLEDLGDRLFLSAVSSENANDLYIAALNELIHVQQCPTLEAKLPTFNAEFMLEELNRLREWFIGRYLNLTLTHSEEVLIDETFAWLIEEINQQPKVFIHRDYHSRNLMILESDPKIRLGVIDFQDAMNGPFTYDLVSLLKDCYIQWPRDQVIQWLTYFYQNLPNTFNWSLSDFTRAFDICGLQRHLKVLGIFCRLHFRDQKSGYLNDLPLIWDYVFTSLETLPELKSFYLFLKTRLNTVFLERQACALS